MPMFEYVCEACGNKTDKIVLWDERDNKVECEKCKGNMKRAEVQRSNFHLKGEGWHDPHGGVR